MTSHLSSRNPCATLGPELSVWPYFIGIFGEMDVLDHGAALDHPGRAFELQVLDSRDAVTLAACRLNPWTLMSMWCFSATRAEMRK